MGKKLRLKRLESRELVVEETDQLLSEGGEETLVVTRRPPRNRREGFYCQAHREANGRIG